MNRSLLIISAIILIDIVGTLYGYYYYEDQLGSQPLYLWLFIPDCPFYVMLFTIALVLAIFGFENKLFNYISIVGMMKYGIWTASALLVYGDYFFSSSFLLLSSVLFILHIGMFLEGPLLMPKKLSRAYLAVVLSWFLINDYFDYFYGFVDNQARYIMGTHPLLPFADRIPIMMVVTIFLSIFMTLLVYEWSFGNTEWFAKKELRDVQQYLQKIRNTNRGSRRSKR